jgi:hypothetical protein
MSSKNDRTVVTISHWHVATGRFQSLLPSDADVCVMHCESTGKVMSSLVWPI